MSPQSSSTGKNEIVWPSVVTFGLSDTGAHILQAALFAIGVLIMIAFIRAAQRVEPFTKRA